MATTRLMTAESFAALDEDGYRIDLVRGELVRMAAAGFRHGRFAADLAWHLNNFVKPRNLGTVVGAETGFVLARDPDTVLAPDAAFVRADRLPPESEQEGFLSLAPDLVIEVVSRTDRAGRINEKVQEYLAAGVLLVWLLRPRRRTVQVYRADGTSITLTEADTLDGEAVLPGFRLPVADLFT